VSAPALEARSLYRFFHAGDDETLALQGVSLRVAAGEMVAVVGPSGSGKSTLLACLAGMDDPDGGTVHVAGERISRRPERERRALRARHIGMLFQSGNLVDHLTVAGNVELAQRLAGRRDRRRAAALLEDLGVAARAGAHPGRLSGGELCRAGIAVALAADPTVVLADEPTGEVDSATGARVLDLLLERARCGVAVVVVTHSDAVAGAADRVVVLADGRLVTGGRTADKQAPPAGGPGGVPPK
jgi:putative ABC transport system ATP-binding protein